MNPTSLLLTGLLLAPLAGQPQEFSKVSAPETSSPDTLFVTDTETTYLLFPREVELVDIGRPGDYFARIEGQSVFLKARSKQSGSTNLLVRFGASYYTARLAVAEGPAGRLYDLRGIAGGEGVSRLGSAGKVAEDPAMIRASLLHLRELPHRHATPRNTRDGLQLRLSQLQIRGEVLYLGLTLRNGTSIAYVPDFVGFTYLERRGRRFSRNNRYQKEVRPISELAPDRIPSREEHTLWYALPLYAMSSRGRLQLQFREREGGRALRILLPARWINQAPSFPDGHGY
ncbi:DUF4138 domain-containing protein [Cesiribacter andamanensis]|uniref:Conjugative transposon TraN protein n=1 Tax=Cesiribacter andamanensis AMV16 TaxID=1279009 RepID=M7NQB7_9BACT|nr:DUF4138 domain-containing protein [Cesiribacter andamanensis]EMR00709.1 conjugative transposon TraN protein [Cesiribacter andamanensis AMV16]